MALDDVDRVLFRAMSIHEQFAHLAADEGLADRLQARSRQLADALLRFSRARMAQRQMPELEDPERTGLHTESGRRFERKLSVLGDVHGLACGDSEPGGPRRHEAGSGR